ncbi:site-specific integrase [Butyricicoccus faecihominis]|uniref:site-specific integrase n=1 Tax=Butyricicoccus faecihominis TaxID=1712515 RepID=UPI00247B118D|nr:site-specific integrase [Butyricicoccus faecihominis]MCQ5131448.1 site-specific integrase [Butyricicoccus faecihominis]
MATIEKRGDSYRITASCGYDLTGAQVRKRMTWTPESGMTERQIAKELQRQAVLFEEKCTTGQVLEGNVRFADFAEQWFTDYAERQLRPTTVARYRTLMSRINAAIGHIRLDKLRPNHLMSFYKNLQQKGVRRDIKYKCAGDLIAILRSKNYSHKAFADLAGVGITVIYCAGRGETISLRSAERISDALSAPLDKLFVPVSKDVLSDSTVQHHHRLISSILSTAVKWQVIYSNPCERVDPPKARRKEASYLDETQANHMLELLEKESVQHRTIVRLLMFTGLRRGELCGLEWKDVDFEHSLLRIRRSSLYLSGKGVFADETKNESSERCLKISSAALDSLREQRAWQLQERLRLGDRWKNTDRIFTCWDGRPIRPDTITGWFHKFAVRNGLPSIHVHSLRHTNATLLIAAGTNLPTVAKRLGHADTTTTSKVYAHAIKSADEAAADTLQNILHPVKRQA